MADTRQDVAIPNATWTNLVSLSGVTTGAAVTLYNKGIYSCLIVQKASQPSSVYGIPLLGETPVSLNAMTVASGSSGLWAYCPDGTTSILVQD